MQKLHQWKACETFPVLERKDKDRKLYLLSVRIFSSGQQNLLSEDFEGKSGMFLNKKDKYAKAL